MRWIQLSFCVVFSPLLASVGGCYRPRPQFVEPSWGDAPPPLPEQIAEITLGRTRCAERCRMDRLVLRRDGRALWVYSTGKRQDSLLVATIDSLTFLQLAAKVVTDSLFQGRGDATGVAEPFATTSTVLSASVICRRHVDQWERDLSAGSRPARLVQAVDSVARGLEWQRCCRA